MSVVSVPSVEESKRILLTDKLKLRDDERMRKLEKTRSDRDEGVPENESVTYFLTHFRESVGAIEKDVVTSETIGDKALLPAHFDHVNQAIHKLTKFLADSKLFLPTYDIRKSQEKIDHLNETLLAKRSALIPKKRFGFKDKSRKNLPSLSISSVTPPPATTNNDSSQGTAGQVKQSQSHVDEGDCVLKDKTNEKLILSSDQVTQQVVGIFRMEDSTVILKGSPSAVHVRGLRNCKLLTGPVSGSIFVDHCQSCTFVLACQQLRIHTTTDSSFYIHVTSKAIIEDCNKVQFAPYNLDYPELDMDYVVSELNPLRNNWNQVDDFNFLATGVASPNWSVIPDSERITEWPEISESLISNGVGNGL